MYKMIIKCSVISEVRASIFIYLKIWKYTIEYNSFQNNTKFIIICNKYVSTMHFIQCHDKLCLTKFKKKRQVLSDTKSLGDILNIYT